MNKRLLRGHAAWLFLPALLLVVWALWPHHQHQGGKKQPGRTSSADSTIHRSLLSKWGKVAASVGQRAARSTARRSRTATCPKSSA